MISSWLTVKLLPPEGASDEASERYRFGEDGLV
jgi:hypothetical protein